MPRLDTSHLHVDFRTAQFAIEPGEDEVTSPGCYGRALAHWLHEQLVARGWPAAEPESHSWGWYIDMPKAEFRLTLYCGTRVALPSPDSPPPPAAEVIWSCAVIVDLPFRWRFWQPGPDAMPAAHALFADVLGLVRSLPDVQDVDIG